ncbi:MAG: GNAT family N-acetyltransferase [Pirellulaceae bacterium]
MIHCDQELARRLERAEGLANAEFVTARATAFPDVGCDWTEINSALAMFDGAGSPCSQTFGLGLDGEVANADLDQLEAFFHERGCDVCHEVCSLVDPSVPPLLSQRGYQPVEMSSVLIQPLDAKRQSSSLGDAIRVREINPDEHGLWAGTAAAGWKDVAPGLEEYMLGLALVNPCRAQTHCLIAEKQDEAIAAGAICLIENVGLLAGACTIPACRRQGAQLALLERRLQLAAEHSCDLAMMVAAPGSNSQRNAERQGFRVAYTRTKWQLPI